VRDPLIRTMSAFSELEEYAETSEDMELRMLIDIVDEYGAGIPALLQKISSRHVNDDQRDRADMIFSTLHRCKGMEYDSVILTPDFMTEVRLKKLLAGGNREQPVDREKLSEEINLAYVAVTRSRNFLDFPDAMFPHADKTLFAEKRNRLRKPSNKQWGDKWRSPPHSKKFENAYKPWSPDDDERLTLLYGKGMPVSKLSRFFDRKPGAIAARLQKIG
jgi:superfamily I DNA/RNA helicase